MNELLDDIAKKEDNGSRYAKLALFCSVIVLLITVYYTYRLFFDLEVNNLKPPPLIFGVVIRISLFLNLIFIMVSIYKRETPSWIKWLAIISFMVLVFTLFVPRAYFFYKNI